MPHRGDTPGIVCTAQCGMAANLALECIGDHLLAGTAVTAASAAATGGGGGGVGGLLEALLIGAGTELGMPARMHQEPAQRRRNVHRSGLISSPQTVVVAPTSNRRSRTTTTSQISPSGPGRDFSSRVTSLQFIED